MMRPAVDPLVGYEAIAASFRSGVLESVHHAAVVTLDRDGRIAYSAGDPELEIYPRSSMKPLQAASMVSSGLDLPDDLLALVCSSHDGSAQHLDGVRRILALHGLDEHALNNTPDLPLDDELAHDALRHGGVPSSIQQNCSGKHAGMLATCVNAGWAHDASYLREDHPLQTAITASLPSITGSEVAAIGVDGCGAPAHVISLVGLARAFRRLATGDAGDHGLRVHRAMTSNPVMVGGARRDVSLLMRGVPGLMAKDGAEGVFAVALPDGRAVAMKVADGANRARPPIMRGALAAIGIDTSGVDPHAFSSPILGHGRPVGEVRIVGSLAALVGD